MKSTFSCALVVSLLIISSLAFAEESIPSLLGKWNTESMGGIIIHGKKQSKSTHWNTGQKILNGQIEFLTQEGRFVTGVYKSDRHTEKFIAMISFDGKSLHASDTDGFFDAKLIDSDTMELVYRHVKASDSVIAIATVKRQK